MEQEFGKVPVLVSDGSPVALSVGDETKLRAHIESGHVHKNNRCQVCVEALGPVVQHRGIPDERKSTHVLHIDLGGPYVPTVNDEKYLLVGALRLPEKPLWVVSRLTHGRSSKEVGGKVLEMVNELNALDVEGERLIELGGDESGRVGRRVLRVHSDRASEFVSESFTDTLRQAGLHFSTTR
eukprot:6489754-Amphidinium_carterae.1